MKEGLLEAILFRFLVVFVVVMLFVAALMTIDYIITNG